jgi:hypothetical protein
MASTYTDLGLELMATGENAGTWGTKTNANLSLVEQLTGGYLSLAVAGSGTTALSIAEGALTGTAQHRVIELTGALTGSRILTFPLLTENFYFIKNSTTGAETLQLKAVSGSGATVTWATDDKGWKIIWLDGVATNTGVYEVPFSNYAPNDWLTKTGSYTAVDQDRIFVDTSGGAVTITLPASPAVGAQVNFVDSRYTFDTNALTVGRNSSKIANAAADLVVNTEGAAFGLVFSGANVGWTYTEK